MTRKGGTPRTTSTKGRREHRDRGEQVAAKRRGCGTDGNLQGDQHADQNRVEVGGFDHRCKDRHQDQDHHNRVHEHAAHEKGDVHSQQRHQRPGLIQAQ